LKIFLNDQLVDEKDAKVSVLDHGLLYGDGVFEGIRVYNSKIFRLKEHMVRLYTSAATIELEIPMTQDALTEIIKETVKANNVENGYIRAVITRGVGTLGLNPRLCKAASVIVIADSIALYPEEAYTDGLEVAIARTIRNHPDALPPKVKSLNYLNNILAKIEGLEKGLPEMIMKNHKGHICECTGDNIFVVKDGALITPPVSSGILEGVTRAAVMAIAEEEGILVQEKDFNEALLFEADECFLTGTAAEVVPVVKVDNRKIKDGKPGPVTIKLLARFKDITREG